MRALVGGCIVQLLVGASCASPACRWTACNTALPAGVPQLTLAGAADGMTITITGVTGNDNGESAPAALLCIASGRPPRRA